MPTDHDWPEEEPTTEEDAVKRTIKRIDELNKGVTGDLWRMHQNCHKEVFENGNMEHMPMNFIRYEPNKELFYICRNCISKYLMEHPEEVDNITILRGDVTKECKEFFRKRAEEEAKKQEEEKT